MAEFVKAAVDDAKAQEKETDSSNTTASAPALSSSSTGGKIPNDQISEEERAAIAGFRADDRVVKMLASVEPLQLSLQLQLHLLLLPLLLPRNPLSCNTIFFSLLYFAFP